MVTGGILVPAPADLSAAVPARATDVEIDQLRATAAAAFAQRTRQAYEGAWARFGAWCVERGATDLPADAGTVALFLRTVKTHDGRDEVPAVGTLGIYRSVIHRAHVRARLPSPLDDPRVQEIWQGLRRERGGPIQGAAALTLDDLERILPRLPATPRGARDRALLLVGVAAALRRSELVELQLQDIAFERAGVTLTLRRSKTDQEGVGAVLGLPRTDDPVLCPVSALRAWVEVLLDGGHAVARRDPLFRGVAAADRIHPRRMHPDSVNRAVKRCVRLGGMDPAGYSAHSLRVGFVTSADALGLTVGEIKAQSRHTTDRMVLHYTRHERALRDSPVAKMFTADRKRG